MQRSDQPLLAIARRAIGEAGGDAKTASKTASQVRLEAADDAYAVTLTPLAFPAGRWRP